MDVLVVLASQPKALVTKEQLLESVWPNVVVVEGVIKRCIAQLREVLGDDAHEPQFIETIARKGYRLLVAVEPLALATSPTKPTTAPAIEHSVAQPRSKAARAALVAAALPLRLQPSCSPLVGRARSAAPTFLARCRAPLPSP